MRAGVLLARLSLPVALWLVAQDSFVPWPCNGLLHADLAPAELGFAGRWTGLGLLTITAVLVGAVAGGLLRFALPARGDVLGPALMCAPLVALLAFFDYRVMYADYVTAREAAVMGGVVAGVAAIGTAAGVVLVTQALTLLREEHAAPREVEVQA